MSFFWKPRSWVVEARGSDVFTTFLTGTGKHGGATIIRWFEVAVDAFEHSGARTITLRPGYNFVVSVALVAVCHDAPKHVALQFAAFGAKTFRRVFFSLLFLLYHSCSIAARCQTVTYGSPRRNW